MAEHRIHVGGERIFPLLSMLWIFPPGFVAGDELLGCLLEGDGLGGLGTRSVPLFAPMLDRVYPLGAQPPGLAGEFTGAFERHI